MTRAERSRLMGRIQGDRLKPELAVDAALRSLGYRPRRNDPALPGRPDFVLPRLRVALFVHGCFWHGCEKHYRLPKSNVDFWLNKWVCNRRRDRRVTRQLRQGGWSVVVLWEHDTKCGKRELAQKLRHRLSLVSRRRTAARPSS